MNGWRAGLDDLIVPSTLPTILFICEVICAFILLTTVFELLQFMSWTS